jgi:serine/threonine-protein kinase
MIGEKIGRYQVTALLGKGGMAAVYKAHDDRLGRDVAIKLILPGFEHSEIFLKRFEREARSLAQLAHPNIVSVLDYGTHNGQPYLVMEYIAGGSLKDRVGKPIPSIQAARWLAPVARALHYAHQQSIIHRDLKPANLLITQSGDLMLSDFGIAKLVDSEASSQLTASGESIGTPAYMAPEQGLGKVVDARSDIYSLGVVFYEMITGRSPFKADTPVAVMLKHVTEPLPRPREFVPQIPEFVENALLTALAKDPVQRYPTMAAFADDLDRIAIGLETASQPAQSSHTALNPIPYESTIYTTPPPQPTGQRTNVVGNTGSGTAPRPAAPARPNYAKHLLWIVPILLLGCGVFAVVGLIVGRQLFVQNNYPTAAATEITVVQATSIPTEKIALLPTQTPEPPRVVTETPVDVAAIATFSPTPPPVDTSTPTPDWTATPEPNVSPKDGMTLIYVPEGEFWMGAPDSDANADKDERPRHKVYLDAFWIDRTEITIAMFERFVNATGYLTEAETRGESYVHNVNGWEVVEGATWQHPYGEWSDVNGMGAYPVGHISWADASAYCQWAGRRLPTEAEWEKAARGTDERMYPWGNDISCERAQFTGCNGDLRMAGATLEGASPYGALDMAGNQWEWVFDWYKPSYYSESPERNPTGPKAGGLHVQRGGSWLMEASFQRSTNRSGIVLDQTWQSDGFRCATNRLP